MNYDCRNSSADQSQRGLNALEPGESASNSSTSSFFGNGCAPARPVVALNIPLGQWHTVRALESGTVILECKDGPYAPIGPEDILAQ
jgi:hypothetical protein